MNCQEQAAVAIGAGEGGKSAAWCYAYRGHDVSCPYTSKAKSTAKNGCAARTNRCRAFRPRPAFVRGKRQPSGPPIKATGTDRKSTRLNSSHRTISYAVCCLKKKKERTSGVPGIGRITLGRFTSLHRRCASDMVALVSYHRKGDTSRLT